MGLIIARWGNSDDDGIYWQFDDERLYSGELDPDQTLFATMTRYLTTGETMEILKYVPDTPSKTVVESKVEIVTKTTIMQVLIPERKAHDWEPGD
jgi:hypothetical protein